MSLMQDRRGDGWQGSIEQAEKLLLHVFPSFSYGGQQARLAALSRAFGHDFRHHIIALDGNLEARSLFDGAAGVSFASFEMKKTPGLSISNILRLKKLIANLKPDLLCTYNWGSVEAVIANQLGAKAPHVHFEDGFGPGERIDRQAPRRVWARRLVLARSNVIVPSLGLKKAAFELWKLRRVHHIENGVDFDMMQTGKRIHNDAIVVGSLGALRPEKNYARLITAFKVADREKKARLEIVGDGPEHSHLCVLAGDDARISLPGATSATADAYARFDIFALSSDTEQAPVSLMEAMAAGLPVIATNVGDIETIVSKENRAFITSLHDEDTYVHALAQLIQDPSARAAIGAANKHKAKEAFSLERMALAHRNLYLSLMDRHD